MSNRPSDKEKINKVRDALEAVKAGQCKMPLTKHVVGDREELEIDNETEHWRLIKAALEEICAGGPEKLYAGKHPPEKCYENGLQDQELWAYRWVSKFCKKEMYLKFVIKNHTYFHINCHENRKKG